MEFSVQPHQNQKLGYGCLVFRYVGIYRVPHKHSDNQPISLVGMLGYIQHIAVNGGAYSLDVGPGGYRVDNKDRYIKNILSTLFTAEFQCSLLNFCSSGLRSLFGRKAVTFHFLLKRAKFYCGSWA